MPYTNTTAEFRPELQVKVEEAAAIDTSFIGDLIFPVFPVMTRKGYYKRIKRGKGQLMANPGKAKADDPLVRAPGMAYREVTRTFEQDSWLCTDRGLEEPVDDVNKQEESRFFDLESSVAQWLYRNMRIARESRIAAEVFSEENWGDAIQADVAFDEAHIDTFDFPTLVKAARRAIKKRQEDINLTLVLSEELFDLVTSSTKLRTFFFGTSNGSAAIDAEMIAKKFRLANVLIGSASYDTTKPGKDSTDDNLVWTWGNKFMWLGSVIGGPPEAGGAGRTVLLEDTTNGQLFVTETYREEKIRSDRLRVRSDDDVKIVNENAGVLVQVNELT